MKNWLKTKLRRFLCEHRNAELKKQIVTKLEIHDPLLHDDYTIEPGGSSDIILYVKKWFHCKDCGINSTFVYKAK